MTPPTAIRLAVAAALAATIAAPAAGAVEPQPPLNPVCAVTTPIEEGNPGQEVVCESEVGAGANVTVGGLGQPCIQVYPYSELCSSTTVGAQAHAEGHGALEACVAVDQIAEACEPHPFVRPQASVLP